MLREAGDTSLGGSNARSCNAGVAGARDTVSAVVEAAMGKMAAAAEKIAPLWFPCSQKLALAPRMTA